LYCSNCGEEIKTPNQNFCMACGSTLPSSIEAIEGTINNNDSGLFNINRNFYIIKRDFWELESSEFWNEKRQVIGKIIKIKKEYKKGKMIHSHTEIQRVDGTVWASYADWIKDHEGNILGKLQEGASFTTTRLFLKDPEGNKLYKAKYRDTSIWTKNKGGSAPIIEISTGKTIAEIQVSSKKQDMITLKFLDKETDRRIIFCFTLSITHSALIPQVTDVWI